MIVYTVLIERCSIYEQTHIFCHIPITGSRNYFSYSNAFWGTNLAPQNSVKLSTIWATSSNLCHANISTEALPYTTFKCGKMIKNMIVKDICIVVTKCILQLWASAVGFLFLFLFVKTAGRYKCHLFARHCLFTLVSRSQMLVLFQTANNDWSGRKV